MKDQEMSDFIGDCVLFLFFATVVVLAFVAVALFL